MRNLSIKHDVTEKWNFCPLSSAFCAVEWKYLYLRRIVGDIFLFLCDLGHQTLSLLAWYVASRASWSPWLNFYYVDHWLLQVWWLQKEPFLATYSAMSNQHSTEQGAVAPKRALYLKFGSSALCLHHSWDCLIQNVINVLCAFQRGYFPFPELLDAIYKFLFGAWLHFWL